MCDAEPPHGQLGVTLPGSDRVRRQQMLFGEEEIRMSGFVSSFSFVKSCYWAGRPLVDEISP